MAENEKNAINMEFVDEPTEDEKQENKPVPTQEPPKPEEVKEEKKTSLPRKIWNGITFVPRWCGRKLKESPAAGVIGMVLGAGATLGGKILIDKFGEHRSSGGDGDDFIPADQPEIEVPDYGEDYVTSDDSTTYTTTEE